MTKQIINTGTGANSRDGDSLRNAFTKVNANFTELYDLISDISPSTGVIGGDRVIANKAPLSSKGETGDRVGMIAATTDYLYVCTLDWTDGVADIWSRTAITASTW